MEIINNSKFNVIVSEENEINTVFSISYMGGHSYFPNTAPMNLYLKIKHDLILIKKVTEFCNKIIIKDSLIENEVEIEVIE